MFFPTSLHDPHFQPPDRTVKPLALGDDAAENSRAIQSHIDRGYAVIIPIGNFRFSETINLRKGARIYGAGRHSVLKYTGTGVALQETEGAYTNGFNFMALCDFALACTGAATDGLKFTDGHDVELRGVFFDGNSQGGFTNAALHLVGSLPAQNSGIVRIKDCTFYLPAGDGVRISGSGGAAGVWVEGCHLYGCGGWGVRAIVPNPPYPGSNLHVERNVIQGCEAGGVYADVLYGSSINGNYFENPAGGTESLVKIGSAGFGHGVQINNNQFGSVNADYCIECELGEVQGSICDNAFAGASTAAIRVNLGKNLRVMGNVLDPSVGNLLSLGNTSAGVLRQEQNALEWFAGGVWTSLV